MKKNNNNIKKLSDYIMNFAFLYSSLVCFTTAAEKWYDQRGLAIIILVCGIFSFIAVFRIKIAFLVNKIRNSKEYE
tara:strand:- start:1357 stop:1584 length:228 start_codon:yes stop_codon:yes gene_type:complete